MNSLPAQDLRSNVGTWSVPTCCLPAVAHEMAHVLPPEQFDPEFTGQYLQTTYLDTQDFDLRKARRKGDKYLTIRVRCYAQSQGAGHDYPSGTYALSAKTEGAKFRVEIPSYQAEDILVHGASRELVAGLLPGDLLARLAELADDEPLGPVVTVCFQRYASEDPVHRLTLDVDIKTDTGRCYPTNVLEQKSTNKEALPLLALPLRPVKLSKFLWATS
jgi:hypothetical protein